VYAICMVLATLHVHAYAYMTHTISNTRTKKTPWGQRINSYCSPAHPCTCIIHCTHTRAATASLLAQK
jgi:hypothetical protein